MAKSLKLSVQRLVFHLVNPSVSSAADQVDRWKLIVNTAAFHIFSRLVTNKLIKNSSLFQPVFDPVSLCANLLVGGAGLADMTDKSQQQQLPRLKVGQPKRHISHVKVAHL